MMNITIDRLAWHGKEKEKIKEIVSSILFYMMEYKLEGELRISRFEVYIGIVPLTRISMHDLSKFTQDLSRALGVKIDELMFIDSAIRITIPLKKIGGGDVNVSHVS